MSSQTVFDRHSRVSTYWLNKSNDLYAAAATLWSAMDAARSRQLVEEFGLPPGFDMRAALPSVFRMLCGMSLELLYKAILVSKDREVPFTHDLNVLARAGGVPESPGDAGLLEILSEAIVWDGRYPVPKQQERWDRLTRLEFDHLHDREPMGRFSVFTPNGALGWDGFQQLHQRALVEYVPSSV